MRIFWRVLVVVVLVAAIVGIVAYNFFVTKVDNFTYMIDEASYNVVQILNTRTND